MFGSHRMILALQQSTFARRAIRPLTLVLLAFAGLSCADSSKYLYKPAENATAMTEGYAAARYAIPAASPMGDVRIASFGVHDVAEDQDAPEWPAVHVRLIVSNDAGEGVWTVDTREIRVELRGAKPMPPAAVNADANELPEIHVAPGEERTLDLFYPLPDNQADASTVPAFDVLWKVHTDAGIVVERTPFERLALASNTSVGYGVGYSPYWWGNPWYSSSYPMPLGPGLTGPGIIRPGLSGPGMMGPSGGSRFFIHAHPSLHQ